MSTILTKNVAQNAQLNNSFKDVTSTPKTDVAKKGLIYRADLKVLIKMMGIENKKRNDNR